MFSSSTAAAASISTPDNSVTAALFAQAEPQLDVVDWEQADGTDGATGTYVSSEVPSDFVSNFSDLTAESPIKEQPINSNKQVNPGYVIVSHSTALLPAIEVTCSLSSSGPGDRCDNGSKNPAGYIQQGSASAGYLYNRGHSLGEEIIGGIAGKDSSGNVVNANRWGSFLPNPTSVFQGSEHNLNNVTTQTTWANQVGQLYYETKVIDSIESSTPGIVDYSVKPIYANSTDLVPLGNQITAECVSSPEPAGCPTFDAFIPNAQAGYSIDYATGNIL
jgi:hypothetical protein